MGKRILFIIPGKPKGGSEILQANIIQAANKRGNHLMLLTLGREIVNVVPEDVPVERRNAILRHPFDAAPLFVLRQAIHDHRPDVVFCANYPFFVLARIASIGSRNHGRYLITWHEDSDRPKPVQLWYRLLTRLMTRRDELIMTSRKQLEHHARVIPSREGRVRIIHNGVDNRYWSPAPSNFNRKEVRERLGIPLDARLIIMVADLKSENDHRSAVEALQVLCNDLLENAHLLIVGTGVENGRLRLAAMNTGMKKRVHFVGHVRDARELYWSSDLISLTATSAEIYPSATLQGMSCGLPAVATDRSAVAEFIENGVNGFLAGSNPYDIAVKWHKALRQRFSPREIHKRMKQQVNIGRMTREYQEAMGVN